jgi:hypothetical protein
MYLESVITAHFICELFGVVVRALNILIKVLSSNLDVHVEYLNEELCTVQKVVAV